MRLSASGLRRPPWNGVRRGTYRWRSSRPASERIGPARVRTWRSWEVLAHERKNFRPVGREAATGSAPVPQRWGHHHRGDRVRIVKGGGKGDELGHAAEAHAGLDLPAQGRRDRGHVRRRHLLRLLPDGEQDLLLSFRAADVTLQVVVARSHVLHRVDPVQVLRTGQHGDTLEVVGIGIVDVLGVVVVDYRVARDYVNSSDRVDQLDEPEQPDPDVFVDVHAEVLLNRGYRASGLAVRVGAVDLAGAPGPEGNVKVARDRQHDHLLGGRYHADQDHRLREDVVGRELGIVVGAEQQHGESARLVDRNGRR